MRSFLPSYRLRNAATLDAALRMLAEQPGAWRPFAGGTDLMVQLAAGTLQHRQYINVFGLKELRYIDTASDAVVLGGLTTFSDVLRHQTLQAEFPLLCRAAVETGGVANQNRGTVAGNIANASPAADTPPALLVYDAELELASVRGRRVVPYDAIPHRLQADGPCARRVDRRDPAAANATAGSTHYRKVGARRAQAISKVCFAARARMDGGRVADVRLAFGSVAPTVVRATHAEAAIRGAALDEARVRAAVAALERDIAPIDDIRSTARYRHHVAGNLLTEFLARLTTA